MRMRSRHVRPRSRYILQLSGRSNSRVNCPAMPPGHSEGEQTNRRVAQFYSGDASKSLEQSLNPFSSVFRWCRRGRRTGPLDYAEFFGRLRGVHFRADAVSGRLRQSNLARTTYTICANARLGPPRSLPRSRCCDPFLVCFLPMVSCASRFCASPTLHRVREKVMPD
jgi:hypothetical protein